MVRSFTRQRPGSGSRRLGYFGCDGLGPCLLSHQASRSSRNAQGSTTPASWWRWRKRSCLQPPKEVGIDLGLASLAVISDGDKFAPPRFLRSALRKIGRLQRSLSRKVKGSRNRSKARLLVVNAHEKVGSKRLDFLHKLSTQFIRENQTVVLEDLNVSGMLKNRRLAKSISDAGWRMFRTLLEYKAERYGREVRVISRWEPTSQRCSECGHNDGKKPLSVRTWTCAACGSTHDRDINAAKNTLAAGQAERLNACGVKSKSSLLVSDPEAGTRLDQGALCAS